MFKGKLIERLERQKTNLSERSLQELPAPSQMKNLVPAAKFIVKKLMEGKRALIVGDYDTDGIMATTILYGFFMEAGFSEEQVDFIIPSRLRDGYGVSPNIVQYAEENLFDFIVTVDNGISAVEAVKLAKQKGIDVVITDHHTAPAVLPNADFIVNPRVPGETFPYTYISGATVAWYMTAALRAELGSKIDIRKYLDFVAITIISDVMPLNDMNVSLFKYGLKKIRARERHVYQLLWNDWTAPTIDEVEIGFSLVPMINAIGRIDDANIGVNLFLSKDKDEIKTLFDFLKQTNEQRKELTRSYVMSAESFLSTTENATDGKAIIVRNKEFHEGIVGIIAGKLAEKYQRPAFVFSWSEEKGVWKGSGRSAGNIHLYDLTTKASEHILGFGGHKGAVGIGVKDENWDAFEKAILHHAGELPEELFHNESLIPIECQIEDFNHEIIAVLDEYGPFGEGNPRPTFQTKAKVTLTKEFKNGLHFKGEVQSSEKNLTALFFNVEKEPFLEKIASSEEQTIRFYPSRTYDPRAESFSFELVCQLA